MFDMVGFCKDYGISYSYKGKQISSGWLGIPDSINKGVHDTDYHSAWNIAGGYINSWISGYQRLQDWLDATVPSEDIYAIIRKYSFDDVAVQRMNSKVVHATTLKYDFPILTGAKGAVRYLCKRGFDPEYLTQKYNLTWGGYVGDWTYRIILPLYHDGVIVSWQGRLIENIQDVPRYMTLGVEKSLVDPKSVLFNIDNCRGGTVVFVEGPFDVMRFGDGACCSFGTTVTESQLQALAKYNRVIVAFDAGAVSKGQKIAQKLSAMGVKEVFNLDLELGERDMGDLTETEVNILRKELGV